MSLLKQRMVFPEGKLPEKGNDIEEEPEQSSIILKLVDETDTSKKDKNEESKTGEKPSKPSNKSSKKKGAKTNKQAKEGYEKGDEGERDYAKPPMSPELLIAIAVRNLDPHKDVGASCTDIVAFLSLHFPYFNDHYEECKVCTEYYENNLLTFFILF